jgi:hypothetical protein
MNDNTIKQNWFETVSENDINNAINSIEIDWTESVQFGVIKIDNMGDC